MLIPVDLGPAAGLIPGRVTDPVRLSALDATGLIDGPGLAGLDRLTNLTGQILGVPVALVSLVTDREQYFASMFGLPEPWATRQRTPLTHSFCQHVVARNEPLVLEDARVDDRLCANLAIPDLGVIAYAGYPLRSPEGQVLGSFCAIDTKPKAWTPSELEILENLTEAAASEIALLLANLRLRRSGEHLQEVLTSAHDAFVSLDAHGVVAEWNPAAEGLFGWSRESAVGRTLTELIVPDRFAAAHEQGLARVRDGALVSRRMEQTARNRSGVEFLVQMTITVVQHREGPVMHAFLHGVSAHHDREVALQRERTFLAAVVDSVDVGVVACGSDGRTALFNKAMRRIWGSAEEPVSIQTWAQQIGVFRADGVTPFPAADLPLARALAGEPMRDVEMVLNAPGLSPRRFLTNAQPVITADGRGVGAVVALHDVTDQRRGEMLRAAQEAAARAFTETASVTEGVATLLKDVCEVMGWTGGEYWQVDEEHDVLVRLTSWWASSVDTTGLDERDQLRLIRGQGLPGTVWATGSRVWVGDLSAEPDRFPSLTPALQIGLNAAIGLPSQSGQSAGVLLFLAPEMSEPDNQLLTALEGIGAYVGRFLERRRGADLLERLARAREDFDRVIGNVNDHVWTVEVLPGGRYRTVFASSDGKGVFGGPLERDGELDRSFGSLVHPADKNLYAAFHKHVLSGHSAEVECRVVGLDGVTRWVWTRAAIRHEDGRTLLDGISSDVSQRKLGEIELIEERRRLRQAQSIGRVGSWEWDAAANLVTWSSALYELYGVEPGEFNVDQGAPECLHPDDVEAMTLAFQRCAETGEPFVHRYRVIRPSDGQLRVFEARGEALYGSDLSLLRLAGTAMDVTDQVNAEKEIASRAAMLRAILSNSQSLIYVKDLNGRYLMANETLLRARSLTEAELIGQDDTVIDPVLAPLWQANDRRALEGEYSVEEWLDSPTGRHYFESVKFPLRDGDGEVYAVCGISLDVTGRRRAADAMVEARDAALASNAAKTSFLATMSHEIRTPMNAVIGMTDLLLDTALDARQLEYVETVRTSGDALLAIINDILDFSRIEAGEMELENRPFELRRCLEDSLSLVAGVAGGLDLVADVDPGCPQFVRGDLNRLRQVLLNLIGNAVKFTEHGDVLVSVRPRVLPDSSPASGPAAGSAAPSRVELTFSVRDTGIGIPADRMDRLFKSFSQVDASTTRVYGGSGLGLAISRAIVNAMGGDITVASTVGVGSTFSFDVCFDRCDDVVSAEVAAGGVPDLAGHSVLVVDDNDTNRRILRLQLAGWGMTCTDVGTPHEALAMLRDGSRFDLAVLDMNMPDLDGAQLAERIRHLPAGRELPLVLLTSLNVRPRTATSNLFAGFHTKPIRAAALQAMIGDVLAAHRPPNSAAGSGRGRPVPAAGPVLRVLLAEDNLVNQKVASGMLQNLGHHVDIAGDGAEALQAVRERDYDVVLMDIHMPTMDGLDASRAIRAQIPAQRQPHIVAMTASSLPEDRRACAQAGMNDYLLKPVRSVDLAKTLQTVPILATSGEFAAVPVGSVPLNAVPVDDVPVDDVPDAAPASGPAVDPGVFQRLLVEMSADSPSAKAGLVQAYLHQGDQWIAELEAAARAADTDRIRMIAHTLGSSSELLGAAGLAAALATAARSARPGSGHGFAASGDPADLVSGVSAVAAEYLRVARALRLSADGPAPDASAEGESTSARADGDP